MTAYAVHSLGAGLHRVTQPLPARFGEAGHVHAYALEGDRDGDGWTIVDAGLGRSDAAARWGEALAALGARPVARILLTHFHPDHVGGAAALSELTGAPVLQTPIDAADARRWTAPDATTALVVQHLVANGMPHAEARAGSAAAAALGQGVRLPSATEPVRAGSGVDAAGERWRVVGVPGHADGAVALLGERSGRCVAGDTLLPDGRPTVGWYGAGRPDPLGDLLRSLDRLVAADVATVYPGHGEPIVDVPACAGRLASHHAARLEAHREALRPGPLDAYRVSAAVADPSPDPLARRFAVLGTLAHLRHLELRAEVTTQGAAPVLYCLEPDR